MTEPSADRPPTRWAQFKNSATGAEYAARFTALAATGHDVHGEARFCAGLVAPPATVLDAGCGTGRVAIKLTELGYRCTGIDLDPSMLAEARRAAPSLEWITGDLSSYSTDRRYQLIVAAGNVIALLAPGTLDRTLVSLAGLLRSDGLLVTGCGLDRGHLPPGCPVTPLADYDAAAEAAGLGLIRRQAGWTEAEQDLPITGYAVSVHRRH
ncbi:MAG TPA: class I SAM-dependent methyltransferase [Jatrophihabitans sp.]|nr:class I SAM-dependent methyltransferase [Jatrophihabitans sp.]